MGLRPLIIKPLIKKKMSTRINNGKDSYLYCSVNADAANYQILKRYATSQECVEDITPDIIADCEAQGYTDAETQTVINYYANKINMASGEWQVEEDED